MDSRGRRPYRRALLALALALALAPGGCTMLRRGGDESDRTEKKRETLLVVENRHWADVTVYVIRGGARARMGTVTSMSTVTFVVPPEMLSAGADIRLLADPVGSTTEFLSELVRVEPGEEIEWRLANKLIHSSLSVWR